MSFETR